MSRYAVRVTALVMVFFFFFNDTATTEIYTLSLHDALPISVQGPGPVVDLHRLGELADDGPVLPVDDADAEDAALGDQLDRKSTRLNSSHANISYAVFCLKKKKTPMHSFHFTPYLLASNLTL